MSRRSSTLSLMVFGFLVSTFPFRFGRCESCRDVGWEKVSGMKPESLEFESALYTGVDSEGIIVGCFDRCKTLGCTAFLVDFERSICFAVKATSEEFIPEPNATFYQQLCLRVPPACKRERLWQVERTLGAVLLDATSSWMVPRSISRSQCYEECIRAGRTSCKSAQFRTSKALSIDDAIGKCTLSAIERGTRPQAYRASMYRDEYLENQCHNVSTSDYCSYAEYRNATLPYSDLKLPGLNAKECERRCDLSADGFVCRSYTVTYSSDGRSSCLLHSEDTTSLGVSALVPAANALHKEREACLNLKVRCNDTSMIVELTTAEPFDGRMYASGYGEVCGVQGRGRNLTVLTLPLPTREDIDSSKVPACGLAPALSLDQENRTRALVWATIVIQFNPIVQRLGDQAARVGCSLEDREAPEPRNISVHSSFAFLDQNAGLPPIASTVVNASSDVPMITMRILDENAKDAMVTRLGQKLLLRIEMKPADGPYDITAGHLVASSASGESSYLLLDELGCPTDPRTFPALLKDPSDNRSLVSSFDAFKFPDSRVVRFNVVVKFCPNECEPAICRGGSISYGRRKRRSVAGVKEVTRNETPEELSLQLSIVVQSPLISADPLISRENSSPDTVLIAGGNAIDGLLCVDAGLALGLLVFWLIIQIVLIVGCLLAVGRYRHMARRAEEDRADVLARHLYGIHGGNLEIARRVRWADRDTDSPMG